MRTNSDNTELNKARGLIFGLAIGDALGYPTEFMSLNQIKDKFGPNGIQDLTMVSWNTNKACKNSQEEVENLAMGIIDWHKELEPAGDTQVVFCDSAFANDIAKTNMTAILEQNGIKHVRSL